MGAIYKLVEIERDGKIRATAKSSPEKQTLPGGKQLFRFPEYDLLGLHDECAPGSEAMLKPYVIGGNLVTELPPVEKIRERARAGLAQWPSPDHATELSLELEQLAERAHASLFRH
jgi:hypothetical protein